MPPKVAPHVAWQIVDGEAIVIDLASGTTIGLNPTATFLWSQVDGSRDETEMAAALAREYGVAEATAATDTREFLTQMYGRSLIVEPSNAGSSAEAAR